MSCKNSTQARPANRVSRYTSTWYMIDTAVLQQSRIAVVQSIYSTYDGCRTTGLLLLEAVVVVSCYHYKKITQH